MGCGISRKHEKDHRYDACQSITKKTHHDKHDKVIDEKELKR